MDFYTIILFIAIILLILLLTYIGIAMSKIDGTITFPPNVNRCPDYWENNGSGYCVFPIKMGKNTGNFAPFTEAKGIYSGKTGYLTNPDDATTSKLSKLFDDKRAVYVDVGETQIKEMLDVSDSAWQQLYPDLSIVCAKRKWAMSHGISWDGITNSNSC